MQSPTVTRDPSSEKPASLRETAYHTSIEAAVWAIEPSGGSLPAPLRGLY